MSLMPYVRPKYTVGQRLFIYNNNTTDKPTIGSTNGPGGATNPNPIIMDADGYPDNNGTPVDITLVDGATVTVALAAPGSDDPPSAYLWTVDDVVDIGAAAAEWIDPLTAIRTSATTFTVTGDKTADFMAERRLKCIGGADRYTKVSSSVFTTLTTVTVKQTTDNADASSTLHASMDTVYTSIISRGATTGLKIYEDLAYTGIDDGFRGYHQVYFPPLSGEAGVTNYEYYYGNVLRYGTNTTPGTTDMTAAIQAAVDFYSSGNGRVYIPNGTYLVTSTITTDQHRIHIFGDGLIATTIKFEPTGTDICFFFGKGGEGATDAGTIVQCSIERLSLQSSDTTFKKTGVEIKDVSQFRMDEVTIGPTGSWTGNTSIGLRTRGRDAAYFGNLDFECDLPISMGYNTGALGGQLCGDHFNFNNLLLVANSGNPVLTNPCILVEPQVSLTNTSFTGSQAWVHGKHGFYWDNSGTPADGGSFKLTFENVRWEQGDDATGWAFYIDYGAVSTLNSVRFENIYTGDEAQGWFFREVSQVSLVDCSYISTSRVALDIDDNNEVETVSIRNCFWQTGCTANIAANFFLYGSIDTPNASPLPITGTFSSSPTRRDFNSGGALNEWKYDSDGADIVSLPFQDASSVIFALTDSRGASALFSMNTVANTIAIIYQDAAVFTITKGNASTVNVYYEAGTSTWDVENNTAVTRTYFMQSLGSHFGQ